MENFFGVIFSGIFGAIFGSYATLFSYRMPLSESCFGRYFGPKSRCPNCGNVIKTKELIPVINWFFTLGKCSKCKTKIPKSHLFLEVFSTFLFVMCYLKYGFSEQFILYSITCTACLVLVVTDFKNNIFPQQILITLAILSFSIRILDDKTIINLTYSSIVGIIACAGFYKIIYKKVPGLFLNESHFFDYIKFILICSIALQAIDFMIYFLLLLMIFSTMIIVNISRVKKFGFGFCLIAPFIWLIII